MSTVIPIPKGSFILVTGANGYLASHVVDNLLASGYRARGTVRSASKISSLQALWEKKYGPNKFEAAVVEDMQVDGAFDDAVKGVSGVIHVASNLSFSSKAEEVIDSTVKGTMSILRSAAAQPSVKRFVLTSSSIAGDLCIPDKVYDVGENSWNEVSVKQAYSLPENSPVKAFHVYAASKTLGEKAAWKFVQEEKPAFVFNTILPNGNFGPVLDDRSASSVKWLSDTFKGEPGFRARQPMGFVDVRDTARLHVLTLTDPTLSGARLWAVAELFNINDLLSIFRKLRPGQSFLEDFPGAPRNLVRIDNKKATELMGSWIGLEQSVKDTLERFGL